MSRLIVVSNRIPQDKPPAGGLVVAMHDCLKERGGVWIGAAEATAQTPRDELAKLPSTDYDKYVFDLTEDDVRTYYEGYANSILWPICHRRSDIMRITPGFFEGYVAVNERLARMIAKVVEPDDIIWIHDYHFFPLATELRKCGVKNRIGFFLHIPFPTPDGFAALPHPKRFAQWVTDYDLFGLQTQKDVSRLLSVFKSVPNAEILNNGGISYEGSSTTVSSFPIGIDAEAFAVEAEGSADLSLQLKDNDRLIIGIDRLDYSKGLANRMLAFGHWLSEQRDTDQPASYLQVAPPTRENVEAYKIIRDELAQISGTLNGQHSKLDWTPIRYVHQNVERNKLAKLYRRADICMVTPLADGMNLVAKEFIAAQDAADPGVLILSTFAGAAEQLGDALFVNPYDIAEMADAIDTALQMPLAERQRRHSALSKNVYEESINWWSDMYLTKLQNVEVVPAINLSDI